MRCLCDLVCAIHCGVGFGVTLIQTRSQRANRMMTRAFLRSTQDHHLRALPGTASSLKRLLESADRNAGGNSNQVRQYQDLSSVRPRFTKLLEAP
jgi:hypothetical protein